MLKNILCVFIGGGLGSLVRYGISLKTNMLAGSFPVATLVSNTVACAIIGVLTGYFLKHSGNASNETWRLLLVTGFCGGFSTFSTFSQETLKLWQGGETVLALGNVFLSLVLCLAATFLGLIALK
jgi:fluoride exporter